MARLYEAPTRLNHLPGSPIRLGVGEMEDPARNVARLAATSAKNVTISVFMVISPSLRPDVRQQSSFRLQIKLWPSSKI